MSEPGVIPMPTTPTHGDRLALEVGLLSGRLAELVARLPSGRAELESGVSFLESLYADVADGQPMSVWDRDPDARRSADVLHAFDLLSDALSLTPLERELVVLAGLVEEHEGLASVLSTLHFSGKPDATTGLAVQLLCETQQARRELRRLLLIGSAVRHGVIRVTGDGPLFQRSLVIAEDLWPALHGIERWPVALRPDTGTVRAEGLEEWLCRPGARRAVRAIRENRTCTIIVSADHLDVAQGRAAVLCGAAGRECVRYHTASIASTDELALGVVHAISRGMVPIFGMEADESVPNPQCALDLAAGPIVLALRAGSVRVDSAAPVIQTFADPLSSAARATMWRAALPELTDQAQRLAASYTIEPHAAAAVAADARCLAQLEDREVQFADVADSVRGRANTSISAGLRLVRPVAEWPDLILPDHQAGLLREAVNRLTLQERVLDTWGFLAGRVGARGVRMLFSGPSGTGKTLAAEVLASSLGVDLLVVDLSRVVSKWIGETEKHLAQVFDAAERAQAVLLFDEADALFGKRTDVSDAHDRYANLETAYLLTRIERFEGLTVLTTNISSNIDSAFLRRLEFVVEFEEPDVDARKQLWRCHLPADAPLADDVDIADIAQRYAIPGALIRNAATSAAFLAAAADTPIRQQDLQHALKHEYAKTGRAFPTRAVTGSGL